MPYARTSRPGVADVLVAILLVLLPILIGMWGAIRQSQTLELRWYWLKIIAFNVPLLVAGTGMTLLPRAMVAWYNRLTQVLRGKNAPLEPWPTWSIVICGVVMVGLSIGAIWPLLTEILARSECLKVSCALYAQP